MNQSTKKRMDVRQLTTLAMLSAVALLLMPIRIPIVAAAPFLKLDFKDVPMIIGGLIYGPFSAFLMSMVVSLIELFTVSESGWWGLLMNVLATCSIAGVAAFVYKHKRTAKGAAIGLVGGVLMMTGVMILWNYLIIPIYSGLPRSTVAGMLLPVFLPFNLVKGALNASLTMLLYKPVVGFLRKTGRLPKPVEAEGEGGKLKINAGMVVVALLVVVSCVVFVLVQRGLM